MGAGKRLSYYIDKQGFTKKEFCENFGFEYNSFVQVLAETRPFGIKMVDKVHEAFPKLNVHWLLYGESQIIINDITNEINEPKENYSINENDTFEMLFLKYMERPKVKNKLYQIFETYEKNKETGK